LPVVLWDVPTHENKSLMNVRKIVIVDELLCEDVMSSVHHQRDFGSGCIEKWTGKIEKNPFMNLSKEVLMMNEYGRLLLCECNAQWTPLT
jgi:hypothetical protein